MKATLINDSHEVTIEVLRAYNFELLNKLTAIRDCTDSKCSLCSSCLNATRPSVIELEIPEIKEDDPIRNTEHFIRHFKLKGCRRK